MADLEAYIAQFNGKTISVAFHDLATNQTIHINADDPFHPASVVKVPVMMEVFRQIENKTFAPDERLPIVNSFTSIADGSPFSLDPKDDSETILYGRIGETETVRQLTRLMIVRSSNLATNILIQALGTQQINAFMLELGIQGVNVARGVEDNVAYYLGMNNSATARGLTQIMKLIAEGKVVSKEASNEMIRILLGQEFNESIPALLSKRVKVAHKTGWTGNFHHDSGIVFPEQRKPYALTIMTRGFPKEDENEAHTCMATISKMLFDQIT